MGGKEFATKIQMLGKNVEELMNYSIKQEADTVSSGLNDFYDAVGILCKSVISETEGIKQAAENARTKIGQLNALYFPPETDIYLGKAAKSLRELSKYKGD